MLCFSSLTIKTAWSDFSHGDFFQIDACVRWDEFCLLGLFVWKSDTQFDVRALILEHYLQISFFVPLLQQVQKGSDGG